MPQIDEQPRSTASRDQRRREHRLAEVRRRDHGAEGRFWCSVVTTGVYCRPTCPSRRARPEHIRFHDTLAEARATGFRPCRRCRPEEPSLNDRHVALIRDVCAQLERSTTPPSVKTLAEQAGLSPSHLYRLFRRIVGVTPSAYVQGVQAKKTSAMAPAAGTEPATSSLQSRGRRGCAPDSRGRQPIRPASASGTPRGCGGRRG